MGQAKIRHIAICTEDTRKLADFYINTFGMTQVMEQTPQDDQGPTDQRAIYVSDGYINLAILPTRGQREEGIEHFGFQVEDCQETGKVAKEAGAKFQISPRPRDGRYAEFRIHDPVGTPVDLAESGWKVE